MIVVTGGAGFIGSNLIEGLNRLGINDIVVVDDLTDASKQLNLHDTSFVDYFDKDDFIDELPGLGSIDAIFHLGACATTTEQDGRFMMKNNFTYSKRLLRACLKRKIPFIYASSAAVYGTANEAFSEQEGFERPLNVYGFSKLVFDQYVRQVLPDTDSQVVGLRYFNVYGPHESHKGDMASVVHKMTERHRNGLPLQLFRGSDGFLRDFIHVRDVVDVNLHFLQSDISGIYNCGTGEARSFQDLGELVARHLGGIPIETIEMPQALSKQYQKYTRSDNSKLRHTGYQKKFRSLEQGIQDHVTQLDQNRAGGT